MTQAVVVDRDSLPARWRLVDRLGLTCLTVELLRVEVNIPVEVLVGKFHRSHLGGHRNPLYMVAKLLENPW